MTESKPAANLKPVELYTDGACSGNPGPGGWAFVLRCPRTLKEIQRSGGQPHTTNNQMELMAVIRGLEALKEPCAVDLYSDSKYVGQGMSSWMAGWKSRGWKRKDGSKLVPVKNVELWQELDRQMQAHRVTYHHVKGHAGHTENELCDQLAVAAYQQYL
ncbi:MAG: ribonuclease HI [Rhodopirellula sp. JB055]|uniref:ribonuclease HI n=1 Tax=Rhodopirellula sp. JB055 TaxID=3342846 RepID=UPI00370BC383